MLPGFNSIVGKTKLDVTEAWDLARCEVGTRLPRRALKVMIRHASMGRQVRGLSTAGEVRDQIASKAPQQNK